MLGASHALSHLRLAASRLVRDLTSFDMDAASVSLREAGSASVPPAWYRRLVRDMAAVIVYMQCARHVFTNRMGCYSNFARDVNAMVRLIKDGLDELWTHTVTGPVAADDAGVPPDGWTPPEDAWTVDDAAVQDLWASDAVPGQGGAPDDVSASEAGADPDARGGSA